MSDLTKKALRDSLLRMLLKKPFDKITVRDITDECDVSRMTFYYHFKDIYDLIDWSAKVNGKALLSWQQEGHSWSETLQRLLSELESHHDEVMNIIDSKAFMLFQSDICDQIYMILHQGLEDASADNDEVDESTCTFAADFYKFAVGGIVVEWARGGMTIPGTALITGFSSIMDDAFKKKTAAE